MAEAGTKAPDLRERVRKIIFEADAPAGKAFDVALIITIIVSVLAVILDTIPSISAEQQAFLQKAEWVFTILFTVEYFTRLWCVESPRLYARSFFLFIHSNSFYKLAIALYLYDIKKDSLSFITNDFYSDDQISWTSDGNNILFVFEKL